MVTQLNEPTIVNALGIDPLQFGMILLVNLGLGLCTPPVGSCLFVGLIS